MKARALQWLAQREQSRAELRRKLMPHAVAEAKLVDSASPSEWGDHALSTAGPLPTAGTQASAIERVEAVLEWLTAHGYLSDARFVESRVHARAARFGNLRIRQELKQHQLALAPEAAQALRESELRRALSVRERKFAEWPADLLERGRQARFLAGRGFSPEVIARALRSERAGSKSDVESMPEASPAPDRTQHR